MAEKRTTASSDETVAAVPRTRAADPEPTPKKSTAKKSTAKKPAAKKTAAKKTQPRKAATAPVPEPEPDPAPAVPVPGRPLPHAEEWAAAAWEAVRRPEQPPQRLAELAVAELGPRAAAWAQWLRVTYPGAPTDGLFRLATRQATQLGRVLSFAGAAGPLAAPVSLPAAGWVRATVVLRVAATYGQDPTAPERAGELLELLGATAETGDSSGEPFEIAVRFARRLRFVRFIPGRLRWRRHPLGSLPRLFLSAGQETDELERLAHRAARFYQAYPGSASKVHSSAESTSSSNSP